MFRKREQGLSFYKTKKKLSAETVREISIWVFEICLMVFLAFVVVYFFGMKTGNIGVSMEPALVNAQEVYVDRFSYAIFSPRRGDVIVFLPNGNENSHYYIKRVVALPGETVQIKNGQLYVDGEALKESGDYDKMADAGIAENELVLDANEYFVLGDNRNNSEDSRSANIGAVAKDTIVGKAWFRRTEGESRPGFIK